MRIFFAFLIVGGAAACALVLATAKLTTVHHSAVKRTNNYALRSGPAYVTKQRGSWQYPLAIIVGVAGLGAGVAVLSARRSPA